MGCETCVFQCPAIVAGEKQATGLETELKAVDQREYGQKSDAIEWDQREEQAKDNDTWTRHLRDQHSGFRTYAAIAKQTNEARRTRLTDAIASVRRRMAARQEKCAKGPRNGWLNAGIIGATVCRSSIKDDGLPNEG